MEAEDKFNVLGAEFPGVYGYYPAVPSVGGYYPEFPGVYGYYPAVPSVGGYYAEVPSVGGYYAEVPSVGGYYPEVSWVYGYYPAVPSVDDSRVLRAVVPPWKVGPLIGAGGKVINEMCDKYDCDITVVHRSENEPTVIIAGKEKDSLIKAFNQVRRIITSPQVPDNGGDIAAFCFLARTSHVKDFSHFAREFQTSIKIQEDLRVASLPDDCIIKIIGHKKDVQKTTSKLAEHFCKYQFNDSVISLFYTEPKRPFQPISPSMVSRNIRVSDDYLIPVESAVGIINTETGIISGVTRDASKILVIEVIGKHKQVDEAIQFLQEVIVREAARNDENVF